MTTKCLATVKAWGNPCTSDSVNPNAVIVTQTATIPTFFAGILGIHKMTLSATSTAARGAKPLPYNLAIILDTTPSMNTYDNNCGATQLQCATQGVQVLLNGLAPSLVSIWQLPVFTFPNIYASTTASNDYDCQSSNPTTGPYTFPSSSATKLSTMPYTTYGNTMQMTYQVTGFSHDYRSSDSSSSLSTTSNIANTVGSKSGCTGIQTSNENTSLRGRDAMLRRLHSLPSR